MRRFIIKTSILLLLVMMVSSYNSVIGLLKVYRNYRFSQYGTIELLKKGNNSSTLIIGSSNIQHNIDDSLIQGVDFLIFPGSLNLTYLQYLTEKKVTQPYKKIILYLPYHFYKNRENGISHISFNYFYHFSFDYFRSFIYHHPSAFFNNWKAEYDSLRKYRVPSGNDPNIFRITNTQTMRNILHQNLDYLSCKGKFDSEKHTISVKSIETDLIRSFFDVEQKVYILFPPIPNTPSNSQTINLLNKSTIYSDNIIFLNSPYFIDSSYFHDQWYHCNDCGRKLETKKLIDILQTKINR